MQLKKLDEMTPEEREIEMKIRRYFRLSLSHEKIETQKSQTRLEERFAHLDREAWAGMTDERCAY